MRRSGPLDPRLGEQGSGCIVAKLGRIDARLDRHQLGTIGSAPPDKVINVMAKRPKLVNTYSLVFAYKPNINCFFDHSRGFNHCLSNNSNLIHELVRRKTQCVNQIFAQNVDIISHRGFGETSSGSRVSAVRTTRGPVPAINLYKDTYEFSSVSVRKPAIENIRFL
jgi:hypothetical protein